MRNIKGKMFCKIFSDLQRGTHEKHKGEMFCPCIFYKLDSRGRYNLCEITGTTLWPLRCSTFNLQACASSSGSPLEIKNILFLPTAL